MTSLETSKKAYGDMFAEYSQIIYEKIRNTQKEVAFLDWAFTSLAQVEVKRVLDVACGTGRHAIPLTKLGYDVIGIDFSNAMLCRFKEQSEEVGLNPKLVGGDMRYLPFVERFDALYCMFSSFNHILTNEELLLALEAFHGGLRTGGIAILDLINPLKFLRIGFQETEVQEYENGGITVERTLKNSIDEINALWHQDEYVIIDDGDSRINHRELHLPVRLLTYPEVRYLANEAGFAESKCFGDFEKREEAKTQAARLIVVTIKH